MEQQEADENASPEGDDQPCYMDGHDSFCVTPCTLARTAAPVVTQM